MSWACHGYMGFCFFLCYVHNPHPFLFYPIQGHRGTLAVIGWDVTACLWWGPTHTHTHTDNIESPVSWYLERALPGWTCKLHAACEFEPTTSSLWGSSSKLGTVLPPTPIFFIWLFYWPTSRPLSLSFSLLYVRVLTLRERADKHSWSFLKEWCWFSIYSGYVQS